MLKDYYRMDNPKINESREEDIKVIITIIISMIICAGITIYFNNYIGYLLNILLSQG